MAITLPYRDRDVNWAPLVAPDAGCGGGIPERHSDANDAAHRRSRHSVLPPLSAGSLSSGAGGWPASLVIRRRKSKSLHGKRHDPAFAAIDWDYAVLSVVILGAGALAAGAIALFGWGLVAVLIGSDHMLPPAVLFSLQQFVHSGA